MEKTKPFDDYFTDEKLEPEKLAYLQAVRALVHDLYPDVQERVAYAMPGFYPKRATKANQQLFFLMANKNWLGIYGTGDLTDDESTVRSIIRIGVEITSGDTKVHGLYVPYDIPEDKLRQLLQLVMKNNFIKNGVELIH